MPDEEQDVDQLDADLGWYALQNFRDDIQDTSRTTGKASRRRSPLKSRTPTKGRRSSAGTVPTPRRQLDMDVSDVRSRRTAGASLSCSCPDLWLSSCARAGRGALSDPYTELHQAQASVAAFAARITAVRRRWVCGRVRVCVVGHQSPSALTVALVFGAAQRGSRARTVTLQEGTQASEGHPPEGRQGEGPAGRATCQVHAARDGRKRVDFDAVTRPLNESLRS